MPKHKATVNHFDPPQPQPEPSFYERFIRSREVIDKGLASGNLVKARIYLTKEPDGTPVGYAKVEGLPQAVKVWGWRHLNRAWSMDEVVLRFVQWTEWGRASDKRLEGIDF